jgi:hypothetical protein
MTCTKPHSSLMLLLILARLPKMQTFNNEMLHAFWFVSRTFAFFFLRLVFPTKFRKARVVRQVGTNILRKHCSALSVFVPWKWDQEDPLQFFLHLYQLTQLIIPE